MAVDGRCRAGLLVGFALPHIWLHAISSLQSLAVLPLYAQALYYIAMGCFLLGVPYLLAAQWGLRNVWPMAADGASGCTLAAIALVAGLALRLPSPAAAGLLMIGGCATAWILLRWFSAICRCGDRGTAVRWVLLSFVIAAAVRLVLVTMPDWLGALETTCVTVAPLASIGFLWAVEKGVGRPAEREGAAPSASSRSENAIYLMELCLCALVLGAFKLPVAASEHVSLSLGVNYALRMLVPVAILVALGNAPFRRLYRPAQGFVLVVLVGVLAFSLLGGEATGSIMAEALLSLARNFALIVIYLVALQNVYCGGAAPLHAFGVARGVFDCSLGMGIVAGSLVEGPAWFGLPATNVVLFCAGVVFLLVMNRLITYVYHYHADAGRTLLDDTCRDVGHRYGLTDREEQILKLLCTGFSKGHIAEKLQLSENTVRWHSKNLYEKLGVHSKQELLELVVGGER